MKKISFKIILLAVVATVSGYAAYQAQSSNGIMSELAMANIEALSWNEGNCAEWITKKCYNDFSNEYGSDYYATCTETTMGGVGECAALESHKPREGAPSYDCLDCIRYY